MSLGITVCHHSASLMMPNGYPRDGFLSYPHTYDRFLYYKVLNTDLFSQLQFVSLKFSAGA